MGQINRIYAARLRSAGRYEAIRFIVEYPGVKG